MGKLLPVFPVRCINDFEFFKFLLMFCASFEVWKLNALCVYEKYTQMLTCVCMLYVFVTLDKICYQNKE